MAPRVFVYGTLRRGGCNHGRMDGARRLGAATVRGRLYSLGWYPGLILDSNALEVLGEVFELTEPNHLAELDRYEGCHPDRPGPHEYQRVEAEVTTRHGPLSAWIWVWQPPRGAALPPAVGADWLDPLPLGRRPVRVDQPLAAG